MLLLAAVVLLVQAGAIAGWLALAPAQLLLFERAVRSALWLAATFAGVTLLTSSLNAAAVRRTGHRLPRLVTDLLAVIVWLVAGIGIASQVFDQPVGGLIATSSVALAVVGFAMRDTIASLVAAIAINVEGPYHLDDWIGLPDGTVARLDEIGWFTTRAVTRDQVRLVLPNSQLAASVHQNFGAAGQFWRDSVYLLLDAALPPARVRRVLEAALLDVEPLRQRPPGRRGDVVLHELILDGANWRLRYWLDDYALAIELRDQVLRAALHHLHHAGLPLARPVRQIAAAQAAGDHREPLVKQLARSELFASLDRQALLALADKAAEHQLPSGAVVIEAGSPGRSLFVVVEGVVEVLAPGEHEDGLRVSTLGPGSHFGEYALLCGEPRSATIRTLCRSRLFEIDRSALAPILQAQPRLAASLSAILERRQSNIQDAVTKRRGDGTEPQPARRGSADLVGTIRQLFGLGDQRAG